MIQANELRIRNWLYHVELCENVQVESISSDQVTIKDHVVWDGDIGLVTGIPLTEEILLKCCKSYEFFHDGVLIYKFDVFNVYKQKSIWVADGLGSYAKRYDHVKHLHQLQNLYFALTGKELEVRL